MALCDAHCRSVGQGERQRSKMRRYRTSSEAVLVSNSFSPSQGHLFFAWRNGHNTRLLGPLVIGNPALWDNVHPAMHRRSPGVQGIGKARRTYPWSTLCRHQCTRSGVCWTNSCLFWLEALQSLQTSTPGPPFAPPELICRICAAAPKPPQSLGGGGGCFDSGVFRKKFRGLCTRAGTSQQG